MGDYERMLDYIEKQRLRKAYEEKAKEELEDTNKAHLTPEPTQRMWYWVLTTIGKWINARRKK